MKPRSVVHAVGCVMFLGILLMTGCDSSKPSAPNAEANEWHEFQGTWTATGSRETMDFAGGRRASISTYHGSVVLQGRSRPNVGFRSDAIVFSDTATGLVGRAVWVDEHGEQVFSELWGDGIAAHNKITGTFVGGTGPYTGANGTYEFSWQFVIENDDGAVQGKSTGLTGRVRVRSQHAEAITRGPRS